MDAEPSTSGKRGDNSSRASSRSSNKSGKRSASPPPSSANNNIKRRRIVQSDSESDADNAGTLASFKASVDEESAPARVDEEILSPKSTAASTKASRKRFAIVDSDSE